MRTHLSALALSLLAVACSGGGGSSGSGSGTGTLEILATDAFLSYLEVEEARVEVTEIRIHKEDEPGAGWRTTYSEAPITMSLLDLRNGRMQPLGGRNTLPTGLYRQVRLVFSGAYLKLKNGNEYSTALGNLKLTSQATSGLKVFIDPPVRIYSDQHEDLLLDFDLTKTFHPIPANNPLNATSYKLQPVIRAANVSETGEIRGVVTTDDGNGTQVPVDGASVYVLPPGELDPQNAVTMTATNPDGSYAVLGLAATTYDVLGEQGGLTARVNGVGVGTGGVTNVDLVLVAPLPAASGTGSLWEVLER
jgi:hypothetical protein